MRVKKRVKRGVKKASKESNRHRPRPTSPARARWWEAPQWCSSLPTKSGRELLIRTAQLTLLPEAAQQKSQEPDVSEADEQESQDSDAREDVDNEPAEDANAEGEPEEDTNGDDESRVTDLKPRDQRPRSAAPGRRPRQRKASNT